MRLLYHLYIRFENQILSILPREINVILKSVGIPYFREATKVGAVGLSRDTQRASTVLASYFSSCKVGSQVIVLSSSFKNYRYFFVCNI